MTEKKTNDPITLPEGRVINQSLFTKDQFNDKATPSYKIEVAFDKGALNDLFNACLDCAVEKWGEGADEDDDLIIPILDGNVLAAKREKKGKVGDVYKDKDVIRANTIFNANGDDAPGGAAVYGPELEVIGMAQMGEVFRGCYGYVAVTLAPYISEGNHGEPDRNAITLYLTAFQKTRGDKDDLIAGSADHSTLFKAVGRADMAESSDSDKEEAKSSGRSRRKG